MPRKNENGFVYVIIRTSF